jgi:beta-N-acetylhexosaminidase
MDPSPESIVLKDLGQLFMVGLPGLTLDDSTRQLIEEFRVNNFIYFKRNVESPEQLKQLSSDLRNACAENGLAPPLISIDRAGGTVTRLPPPFTQFPDARTMADSERPAKVLTEYALTCTRELLDIGVNMNLAPVLDVCETGQHFFMERRALGRTPEEVGRFGNIIIKTMQDNGLAACGKHFPGLGSAKVDPHFKLPQVSRTKAEMLAVDIPPFRQAISSNVAAIMTSHTIYQDLDGDNPATLSATILTGLLRNEMGYNGVIITDDLEMGAIENEGSIEQAALLAFEAGADILLVCHSHEKMIAALKNIREAIRISPVLLERIKESTQRVNLVRQQFAKHR